MKAIKYIFLSYLQQHFFGTLITLGGFLFFIVGIVYSLNSDGPAEKGMLISYFAVIIITFDLTVHIKRLIMSNASALLPDYRKYQLITAGIVFSIFITVPIILGALRGIDILPWVAIFLFSCSILIWMFSQYTDNIFTMLIVLWIIRLGYEILGLPVEVNLIESNPVYQSLISFIMILLSIIIFYINMQRFFRISVLYFEDNDRDDTDPWAKDYDKTGKYTNIYLLNLVKKLSKQGTFSRRRIRRFFQITLFSPHQAVPVSSLGVVLVLTYMISILFIINSDIFIYHDWIIPILMLIYHIAAIMNTTDFLQHRDRIAMLWLYSNAHSRSYFIKSIAGAYIKVMLQNYLGITITYLIIGYAINTIPALPLFYLIMLGLIINLTLIALSLIFFNAISSPEAKGWTITNILISIILMPIIFNFIYSLNLIILGVLMFLAGLLLAGGIKILYQADLDFETPAPYV